MTINLIQLSDIHFSIDETNNPIMQRIDRLIGAFRSELSREDNCLVLFSGDIANRGKQEEYDIAFKFFKKMLLKFLLPKETK